MTRETAPHVPASLADFLLARIAEDERDAKESARIDGDWFDSSHQERWVPTRVLAECEAKRRIVEGYQAWFDASEGELGDDRYYGWLQGLEEAAQHLASVYADHPDYREEWRP